MEWSLTFKAYDALCMENRLSAGCVGYAGIAENQNSCAGFPRGERERVRDRGLTQIWERVAPKVGAPFFIERLSYEMCVSVGGQVQCEPGPYTYKGRKGVSYGFTLTTSHLMA